MDSASLAAALADVVRNRSSEARHYLGALGILRPDCLL